MVRRSTTLFIQMADRTDPVLIVAEPSTTVEAWRKNDPTRALTVVRGFLGLVGGVAVGAALFDGDAVDERNQYDLVDRTSPASGSSVGAAPCCMSPPEPSWAPRWGRWSVARALRSKRSQETP